MQTWDSALPHTKTPQCKSMKQLCINAYIYKVTSLLSSIKKGRGWWWKRACFQSFRTSLKVLYFYYPYIQNLRLCRENSSFFGAGWETWRLHTTSARLHCSRSSMICTPSELSAGRKTSTFASQQILFSLQTEDLKCYWPLSTDFS